MVPLEEGIGLVQLEGEEVMVPMEGGAVMALMVKLEEGAVLVPAARGAAVGVPGADSVSPPLASPLLERRVALMACFLMGCGRI